MSGRDIVEEIVDDIFECPYYSEMQMQKATAFVDSKFKESKQQFAKGLLDLPLEELVSTLEEVANGKS